jgi:hypothetical protein
LDGRSPEIHHLAVGLSIPDSRFAASGLPE